MIVVEYSRHFRWTREEARGDVETLLQSYQGWLRLRELLQYSALDFDGMMGSQGEATLVEDPNDKPSEEGGLEQCTICYARMRCRVLRRCGHAYCATCTEGILTMSNGECPQCRLVSGREDVVPLILN